MRQRNIYLDLVKGLAIFLVVVGHCIQFGSGAEFLNKESYFSDPLFIFIYSFHMPLFMLVSGYLFYDSACRYTAKTLLISRFKNLIIPMASWTICCNVVLLLGKVIMNKEFLLISVPFKILSGFLFSIWFLWAVFYSSMILIIVKTFFHDRLSVYCFIGIVLLFIPDKFNAALIKFMYPYFIIGYLWNKYQLWAKFSLLPLLLRRFCMIIVCLVFVCLLPFYTYDSYIYTTGISLYCRDITAQFMIDGYRWIIGLSGSVTILLLMKKISLITKIGNGGALGKRSLGIYIISGYIFYFLPFITANFKLRYDVVFVEALGVLCIAYICTVLLEKSSMLRKFFLGGR